MSAPSQDRPVPPGAELLDTWVDGVLARPDVAEHLADASRDIANALVAGGAPEPLGTDWATGPGANLKPVSDPRGMGELINDLAETTEFHLFGVERSLGETISIQALFRDTAETPANIEHMLQWARWLMHSRAPDFVIGEDYLRRWYVMPRNPWCNVYLHEIRKSDDDRALHDHPWRNTSLILSGEYDEHVPGGVVVRRRAGDVVEREATALHRLAIDEGGDPVITLFVTGPKVREWGFDCPNGWVPWQVFCDPADPGKRGQGCGE